ncbi:hypothetical protein PMSD_07085 [Paenibacillus macquariensis subsp. defensor]|nr:hypothetical protein PMSD_07085 [Paenibacillus macquariensis subsp. defensor]
MPYKKFILLFVVLIAILSGCTSLTKPEVAQISEEQAKSIVQKYQEQNSNNHETTIISIKYINNEYEITWERKTNCESGTDYVNDKDGTISRSEISIC